MAWYTQILLKNRVDIKSKSDINSDEYNDLIIVEKKIDDLYNAGIISNSEMSLINYMEDGKPIVNSKKSFGKNRMSLAKDFGNLCNKIAFYIGGIFTDEGYIDYMKTKYNLTDEQVGKMQDYMESKYKNKLMRKKTKHESL